MNTEALMRYEEGGDHAYGSGGVWMESLKEPTPLETLGDTLRFLDMFRSQSHHLAMAYSLRYGLLSGTPRPVKEVARIMGIKHASAHSYLHLGKPIARAIIERMMERRS